MRAIRWDALVAKKWGRAVFWQTICALSNPYVGVQFCGVAFMSLILARGPSWRPRLASFLVTGGLGLYYQGIVHFNEAYRVLRTSNTGWLQEPLQMGHFLAGHALPLVGLLADKVYEVADLATDTAQPVPRIGTRWRPDYVRCIARWRDDFVVVPDLARILH